MYNKYIYIYVIHTYTHIRAARAQPEPSTRGRERAPIASDTSHHSIRALIFVPFAVLPEFTKLARAVQQAVFPSRGTSSLGTGHGAKPPLRVVALADERLVARRATECRAVATECWARQGSRAATPTVLVSLC